MIHEHTLEEGRDPEVLLPIRSHSQHRRIVDDTIQVTIATTKLLLIVIIGKESFVVSTKPDIFARVLENLRHQGIGHRDGEFRITLSVERVGQQVQFEDTIVRGAQQDGVILQQSRRLYDAVMRHHP